jgi:FAD:protein FMN transferase
MTAGREHEQRLGLFGTQVRLLVGAPTAPSAFPAGLACARAVALLRRHQARLTRFDADSELSLLNADPREAVEVSSLTARAVEAALWAARRSGGLVDPVVLDAMESAGYARSRAGQERGPLTAALALAPARAPAVPAPGAAWRRISVAGDVVSRPAGTRLDLGGTAKGLAADRAAALLDGHATFAVDAGGDIVIGGTAGTPRQVTVDDPLRGGAAHTFELAAGAVATSGLATRVWSDGERFSHHLIDPATGRPAWTGVIQATAVAATGLEAETLAKTALLRGPSEGLDVLERNGGVLITDDGEVLVAGSLGAKREVAA